MLVLLPRAPETRAIVMSTRANRFFSKIVYSGPEGYTEDSICVVTLFRFVRSRTLYEAVYRESDVNGFVNLFSQPVIEQKSRLREHLPGSRR